MNAIHTPRFDWSEIETIMPTLPRFRMVSPKKLGFGPAATCERSHLTRGTSRLSRMSATSEPCPESRSRPPTSSTWPKRSVGSPRGNATSAPSPRAKLRSATFCDPGGHDAFDTYTLGHFASLCSFASGSIHQPTACRGFAQSDVFPRRITNHHNITQPNTYKSNEHPPFTDR
jgi:hypothetical protein